MATSKKGATNAKKTTKKAATKPVKKVSTKKTEQFRTTQKKKVFLKALRECLGIITVAANAAQISRRQVYTWRYEDEQFALDMEDILEEQIDFVENSMLTQIKKGDSSLTQFYLKTKAKHRGYVERTEIVNKNVDEFDEMTDEELAEFIKKNS